MLTADTKLISVDDHVIEPPGVFVDHIAPRYRDRAPRIVEPEPGVQGWEWEGRFYPLLFQGNAHTRRFREAELGKGDDLFARRYDDMIPAAYDVHERIRTMDEDGVWAELLLPGWYNDDYVRTTDGWRIRRRATTFMRKHGGFDSGHQHDPLAASA